MGSRKRSARARQIEEFKSQLSDGLGDFDDVFAAEEARARKREEDHEAALRYKSCESKNRYDSRAEAQAALDRCADFGRRGLSIYHCERCGGWHLTSHPHQG